MVLDKGHQRGCRLVICRVGLERQAVRRLLREIELRQDVRAGAIFSLFLYSGCRVSDLVGLGRSDDGISIKIFLKIL